MYFQIFVTGDDIELVKLESKNSEKQKFDFNAKTNPIVTIGRNKKCSIFYEDKSFSRVHTTISYVNNKWEIKDGSDKGSSANGTWLYAQNSYEIQNGTIFRVYSSILKISVEEQ